MNEPRGWTAEKGRVIPIPHRPVTLHAEVALLGSRGLVRLAGEIDLSTMDTIHEAVRTCLDARPTHVLIDLSGVTFCDCTGIRALLQAKEETLRAGARFRACGPLKPLLAGLVDYTGAAAHLGLPRRPEQPL